jgi:peptide subunit release factor 1 (eRF1)
MITRDAVRELAQFESEEGCAITFYYQPETPQDQSHRQEAILVKDLVREALKQGEKEGKNACARADLQRILEIAEGLHGNGGRAKAIFADSKQGVWREFDMPPWLPGTQLIINRRFHLKPLAPIVEAKPRVWVCVLDRTKARLFKFNHGEVTELVDFFSDVPRFGKSDGWMGYDAGHKERRIAHDALQHYKQVVEELMAIYDRGGLDAVAFGCREETWAEMQEVLHPYLKQRLIGHFRVDPASVTPAEIAERVETMLDKQEMTRRQVLVREVLGEAHRKGNGAVGLRRVLRSLEAGEVQTLLIGERFRALGSECHNCGHVDLKIGNCPACGQKTHEVDDLTDALIGRALRKGMDVVYIQNDPEFEKVGHIAALLRFRADQNTAMKQAS